MPVSARLFDLLRSEWERVVSRERADADRGILGFPHHQTDALSWALFPSLTTGGFCTHVVDGRTAWNPQSAYHVAVRRAAESGRKIHRAFLLPHRHCRHDTTLHTQVALDTASGIQCSVVHVGELMADLALPSIETLNFGIWDDQVACMGVHDPGGTTSGSFRWRVTSRPEDLEALSRIRDVIASRGLPVDLDGSAPEHPDLEEPMLVTAPLARELSGVLCRGDYVSPGDCGWYHSVWQYLRIFDMVSTPTWHSEFFSQELSQRAFDGDHLRVLVTGTADYSMPAHVMWAFKGAPLLELRVVDLCETPLFLCKWYGKTVGRSVETTVADVLTYQPEIPYDIVTTDAFITRFSAVDKGRLANAWFNQLRPGGVVISTARIEPGIGTGPIEAEGDQVRRFERDAARNARRWQGVIGADPESIAQLARGYASKMLSHSLGSMDELLSILREAGFEVVQTATRTVPGELQETVYAEFVARRPLKANNG